MFCKSAVSNWGSFLDFRIPSEGCPSYRTAAYNSSVHGEVWSEKFLSVKLRSNEDVR